MASKSADTKSGVKPNKRKSGSKKSALGRGLDALFPDGTSGLGDTRSPAGTPLYNFEERAPAAGRVSEVDVAHISSNPYQPRETFDETALNELAASIRELGIIQPVTVRLAAKGAYELISGERRLRAARIAGLTTIPAYIRNADAEAMLEMAIVENVQREELDPIEIGLGYQRLIEECGLTQEDVAIKVGKNRTTVSNFLRLLGLPPVVQASLRGGIISVGHARALLSLEELSQQEALLKEIEAEQLSVRQVEQRVKTLVSASTEQSSKRPATSSQNGSETTHRDQLELNSFVDLLRTAYATQVQIKPQGGDGGGRVEIQYYSADDLERIVDQLLGR